MRKSSNSLKVTYKGEINLFHVVASNLKDV